VTSRLFTAIPLDALTVRNRVWVSPMCQYSAVDGVPDRWHLVHLGSFATGGAGLVFTEATAVVPEGRISPEDTGIWNDRQQRAWAPIAEFVRSQGATVGMKLAHAGRKASTLAPFRGHGPVPDADGGWQPVAPSAVPYPGLRDDVRALSPDEISDVVAGFAAAAGRAADAGFQVLEVHAAHGYLLHEFLSPLSNRRDDGYGGSLENRCRLLLEVVGAVREAAPGVPVLVRVSATDWVEGGWSADDSVRLAVLLRAAGVALVDVSSGGNSPGVRIPVGPSYQVRFAARIRRESGMPTGAVGMITEPAQAERIVADGAADAVLLARAMLRNPHWPLGAAHELGVPDGQVPWPPQYLRARYR
jgi:2,4-dienoyl-CoA reductase-like NADH-dependent reductase (Old Yellow Enzyme family)